MTWEPEGIIIHCSDTRPEWMGKSPMNFKVAEIRRWHVEGNGWSDIAYAELYDRDGTIGMGRDLNGNNDPFDDIGAHTKGWNSKAIGLCLLGGHGSTANDDFFDHFTPEQDSVLRDRIAYLRNRFPSIKWVKGHNEFANKACPGFQVGPWYNVSPPKGNGFLSSKSNRAGSLGITMEAVSQGSEYVGLFGEWSTTAQTILSVGAVCFIGYMIYDRVMKQRRGIH